MPTKSAGIQRVSKSPPPLPLTQKGHRMVAFLCTGMRSDAPARITLGRERRSVVERPCGERNSKAVASPTSRKARKGEAEPHAAPASTRSDLLQQVVKKDPICYILHALDIEKEQMNGLFMSV